MSNFGEEWPQVDVRGLIVPPRSAGLVALCWADTSRLLAAVERKFDKVYQKDLVLDIETERAAADPASGRSLAIKRILSKADCPGRHSGRFCIAEFNRAMSQLLKTHPT